MKSARSIFVLGVTGGIGSGKSTVCSVFQELGVPVLSADDLSKEISNNNQIIKKKIITLLGNEAYSADGLLNRRFVASKIFSDKKLQKNLEKILHPQVALDIDRRLEQLQQNGCRFAVVEAALFYEAGLQAMVDAVLVVDADEQTRIRRVQKRDHVAAESVLERINAQADTKRNAAKADYTFRNNGSKEELARNTQFLYSVLIHLANEDFRAKI